MKIVYRKKCWKEKNKKKRNKNSKNWRDYEKNVRREDRRKERRNNLERKWMKDIKWKLRKKMNGWKRAVENVYRWKKYVTKETENSKWKKRKKKKKIDHINTPLLY